ncbi:septum formation protein Maf [Erwinia sp. CPCC 100877]|nr:septum formation protein Maf [Erwinia sp. CPCC 100877]
MAVILASQSPRRQELLGRIISNFEIVPADIDEQVKEKIAPEAYVQAMALEKATYVAEQYPEDLVIGCDTIVTIDEEILGKPASREAAFRMLRQLSGRTHKVYTSVVMKKGTQQSSVTVPAEVVFYELSDEEIERYLDTSEFKDKAGAYGIQGQGALLIKEIQGDYYAIMGLPVATVYRMLADFK